MYKVLQTGTIRKLGCSFLFTFYSNYGAILSHLRDELLVENRKIFMPHLYLAPVVGDDFVGISQRYVIDTHKTRIIGLLW